jgi:hypothetical protein
MAKETGREEGILAEWRWDVLETLQGLSQFDHYRELLLKLALDQRGFSETSLAPERVAA